MDHPGTEDKREQPYRKNLISRKRLERKKEMKLGGIVPALVTPYDGEGKVNYEMLKKLVEVLLEDGADGFYVTGSTGECFLLSEEERIKITATVAETVNGRVPIVTHVGMIRKGRSHRSLQRSAFLLQFQAGRAGSLLYGDLRCDNPSGDGLQHSQVFRRDHQCRQPGRD